jgi:hypothetical protein
MVDWLCTSMCLNRKVCLVWLSRIRNWLAKVDLQLFSVESSSLKAAAERRVNGEHATDSCDFA